MLLKPQYLGDAVMACPLIDSISAAYAKTIVMCGSLVAEVLHDRANSVRFEKGEKISGVAPVLRTAKTIRSLNVDHVYLVNRSFRSALSTRIAGIPFRIGHATEGRGYLLTNRIAYDPAKFEAECYLDLARAMNVETAEGTPKLCVNDEEKSAAKELLQGAEIGVQPGARYPQKQVPLSVMAEVVRKLQSQGQRIVLLGGPEEAEQTKHFCTLLEKESLDLTGKLAIRQTLGALANLKLMIGSDTGLMHLAAAVGCPTITVFGPNPASKWGHRYGPHKVIEAPEGNMSRISAKAILAAIS